MFCDNGLQAGYTRHYYCSESDPHWMLCTHSLVQCYASFNEYFTVLGRVTLDEGQETSLLGEACITWIVSLMGDKSKIEMYKNIIMYQKYFLVSEAFTLKLISGTNLNTIILPYY